MSLINWARKEVTLILDVAADFKFGSVHLDQWIAPGNISLLRV